MILALETSTTTGSVAVGAAAALVEVRLAPPIRHAEALLPAIDYALDAVGVARRDIAGIAIGGGPGSFTGLRIAGATGKALAHTLGVPLYALSGLLAQAAALAGSTRPVCAMFDARRGEVYAGCWRFDGMVPDALLEPAVGDALGFVERLRAHDVVYVGEGAERNRARLEGAGARLSELYGATPSAALLIELVAAQPDRWRVDAPAAWQPAYVRASSAERGLAV